VHIVFLVTFDVRDVLEERDDCGESDHHANKCYKNWIERRRRRDRIRGEYQNNQIQNNATCDNDAERSPESTILVPDLEEREKERRVKRK
jgi:hypothetical protein